MNGVPTLSDFQTFLASVAGIPPGYLPPSDPIVSYAYGWALDIVNETLSQVPSPSQQGSWSVYEIALYNLATHAVIEFAQDQSFQIVGLSWAPPGVATATLSASSLLASGQVVQVSGCSPIEWNTVDKNGAPLFAYVLSVPDSLHFRYAVPLQPPSPTALGRASYNLFSNTRAQAKVSEFAPGVVTSSSDVSTGASLLNPEFFRNLTLQDLQLLKTVYGRRYLQYAQAYGPTIWALT